MIKQTKNIQNIDLYAITVYTLYQECLSKACLLDGEKQVLKMWSILLYEKLKLVKEINILFQPREWRSDYHNYLRDKYNLVSKMVLHGNSRIPIGSEYDKILPLLMYASRMDYKKFDESFSFIETDLNSPKNDHIHSNTAIVSPVEISVLYTPIAFGRTRIFRNPEQGQINVYPNGDLIFEGQNCLYIRHKDFKGTSVHSMYGDEQSWVKITYEKNGKIHFAYFAEAVSDSGILKLIDPKNILELLAFH